MTQLEFVTKFDCPVHEVFQFHTDVQNLGRITPSNINVVLLHADPFAQSAEIILKITQFNFLSVVWHLRFATVIENQQITDEQVTGPLKYWQHNRYFSQQQDHQLGYSEMREVLKYELPLGVLGRIANALVVKRMIKKMFKHRQEITREILQHSI
ncbi:MAG: hypothetical protein HQ472_09495 [Ignavibacteria bacterium]|nr:hypothetical protein [Ignavibacteria bacterium]